MHFDEAFDYIVAHLAKREIKIGPSGRRDGPQESDLYLPDLMWSYWAKRVDTRHYPSASSLEEEKLIPFYDSAWELCRIGVLRPGTFAPRGGMPTGVGDRYVITKFGEKWLARASERPIVDPGRLADVLQGFSDRFGPGYAQRTKEAVASYRTANYLAGCVMAGAAAESILLALAISKEKGDEEKVLAAYDTAGGRGRVTKIATRGVTPSLASQFETVLNVLHYWRDDASHGTMTTISEIEAHHSLTQLLRLAQFASDHWDQFTAP